jgi:glyceraldehyde 3-phosphate dehydrogenase
MPIKIAINGFGRIGRLAFRQLFDMDDYEIVAIKDLTSTEMLAYLLKYDSVQNTYQHANSITHNETSISVNNKEIAVYNETNAEELPWKKLDIDIVVECSGAYLSKQKAQTHLVAGAKKVVLSAPAGEDIPTIIYGINENILSEEDTLVSAASCSTNALTPMVKALHDTTSILSGIMTVIHGYTEEEYVSTDILGITYT